MFVLINRHKPWSYTFREGILKYLEEEKAERFLGKAIVYGMKYGWGAVDYMFLAIMTT